jgi:threonine synthase
VTVVPAGSPVDPVPLRCANCGGRQPAAAQTVCPECLGPLEPEYDPARPLPDRATIAARPPSLWRYREWLPFAGAPRHSLDSGWTPLVEAPALARRLGVARVWIKNDTVSHPTLSFKDRVVAAAINAAAGLGCEVFACASTGNLANAVAAHAARAGLPAVVLIPEDLEPGKVKASAVHGARVIRIRGTYDDVNRLCVQLGDRFGWGIANVNLRPYYGEGSKTVAFETAEQLGWRLPTAVVAPMAGGSLLSKLHKGFSEFRDAGLVSGPLPRLFGAQAAGCAPIVAAWERNDGRIEPVIPATVARSLAIGNPADGLRAAGCIRATNGAAVAVSDAELVAGVQALARTAGVFAESAGGVTVAGALRLAEAGRLGPDDEVVLCVTAHGLKTPDLVEIPPASLPVAAPRFREVAALVESLVAHPAAPAAPAAA